MDKVRITPARAGTTLLLCNCDESRGDHPRSRGNHGKSGNRNKCARGSPPLAREPQATGSRRWQTMGITPARAGTTRKCFKLEVCCRDHPRSRGNHIGGRPRTSRHSGSPPLAREPRTTPQRQGNDSRITPARAGTTEPLNLSPTVIKDHPRSRGNHFSIPF